MKMSKTTIQINPNFRNIWRIIEHDKKESIHQFILRCNSARIESLRHRDYMFETIGAPISLFTVGPLDWTWKKTDNFPARTVQDRESNGVKATEWLVE